MKLAKNQPIILCEYNEINFQKVVALLKNYDCFLYDYMTGKFSKRIDDFSEKHKIGKLSARNLFFIPKKNKS